MEDIIKTILDVVRVQHSATEGTDEKPFDMDDIVDMTMGVMGRPDEPEEAESLTESIQSMVETLAPDLFPPKTFEQMDDEEKTASVTNMLEERLRNGFMGHNSTSYNMTDPGQAYETPGQNQTYNASVEEQADNPAMTDPSYNDSTSGLNKALSENQPVASDMNTSYDPGSVNQAYDVAAADYSPDMAEYTSMIANALPEEMSGSLNPQETAELNDLIYKNLMEMMGAQPPRVEFPFDRSQIRYGKEKSITEQLLEEQQAAEEASRVQPASPVLEEVVPQPAWQVQSESQTGAGSTVQPERKPRLSAADLAQSLIQQEEPSAMSAWDLAQGAVDRDEEAHKKEPFVPTPVEIPETKSASQLAAEAIARAQEEDKMKLEIEKQAEALMAEAAKRGQDPMKFALHQQEILRYMEKNSDELVSFEDYEDLSPEEKLEVERQIYIEKQIADGVDPDQVDTEVPEEYIPSELRATSESDQAGQDTETGSGDGAGAGRQPAPPMTEDMLRMISREVVNENADMILAENADEDIESLQEAIFENLKQMMSRTGEPVAQEDIGDLIEQAIAANRENQMPASEKSRPESQAEESAGKQSEEKDNASEPEKAAEPGNEQSGEAEPDNNAGQKEMTADKELSTEETPAALSAVELARAAQKAAKAEPKEERQTRSAADIAREAQEKARAEKEKQNQTQAGESAEDSNDPDSLEAVLESLDEDFSDIGEFSDEESSADDAASSWDLSDQNETAEDGSVQESTEKADAAAGAAEGSKESEASEESNVDEEAEEFSQAEDIKEVDEDKEAADETEESEEEEYEYADPDELVLGEHTQAEVDEALENLGTLGLEGEVYERAKRMLLLELAGSEAELDAWLSEQDKSKKKKAVSLAEEPIEDISQLDQDQLEKELELALDEDFLEEEFEEEETAEPLEKDIIDVDSDVSESEIIEILDEDADDTEEDEAEDGIDDVDTDPEEEGNDFGISVEAEVPGKGSRDRKRKVFRKRERAASKDISSRYDDIEEKEAEAKSYQVSTRKPFILKNSASFMDQFEDFITDTQENRRLSTGFKKLDAMLRYGLHKGSYFIDAQPQYLKNGFMQQIADRAAESGIDVLYISTELSRYDLMVETVSRLSYEIHHGDPEKAVSAMAIMTGEDGADLASLKDELNWYRGRISEHLFILDQEAVAEYAAASDEASAGDILTEIISSIVREGAHKPAVFIDNIENILSTEDSEDMKPLIQGISNLAKELGIPILMSYGYAQAESEEELYPEEKEYHESIGNMCDVYMELQYADMITEDSVPLTPEDIRDMVEEGESLLINILLHKNRRPMKASLQIQGTPKYNFFEE